MTKNIHAETTLPQAINFIKAAKQSSNPAQQLAVAIMQHGVDQYTDQQPDRNMMESCLDLIELFGFYKFRDILMLIDANIEALDDPEYDGMT